MRARSYLLLLLSFTLESTGFRIGTETIVHSVNQHRSTIVSADSNYHGYETMQFYLRDLNVLYLAPDCGEPDDRITGFVDVESGFVGPFNFDNAQQASNGMHACGADGTDLGELTIHKDPCDAIGNPARVGISNMGNSCFLNSAMQVLLGIPGICSAIFDERNVLDVARSPLPALRSFADTYRLATGSHGYVYREEARNFRRALLDLGVVDSISGQEDSSEVLSKLFGLYHLPEKSSFISKSSSYLAFKKADLVEDTSGKTNSFDASCSKVNPDECRTHGTEELTPLVQLLLPFMPVESIALDEMYGQSFHREAMESEVRVTISPNPLQRVTRYEKVTELDMAPQILVNMQLEAYDPLHDMVRKRDDRIEVPAVWRGMTLMGISQHMGGDNAGHYIAYKKRCEGVGEEWVQYNDERVSLRDSDTALAAAAEGKLLYFARDPKLPSCDSLSDTEHESSERTSTTIATTTEYVPPEPEIDEDAEKAKNVESASLFSEGYWEIDGKNIKCCVSSAGHSTRMQDVNEDALPKARRLGSKIGCGNMFGNTYHNGLKPFGHRRETTCVLSVAKIMEASGLDLAAILDLKLPEVAH